MFETTLTAILCLMTLVFGLCVLVFKSVKAGGVCLFGTLFCVSGLLATLGASPLAAVILWVLGGGLIVSLLALFFLMSPTQKELSQRRISLTKFFSLILLVISSGLFLRFLPQKGAKEELGTINFEQLQHRLLDQYLVTLTVLGLTLSFALVGTLFLIRKPN